MIVNQYKPDIVFHPITTLNEKLDEMGMNIKDFVIRTGKPEHTMSILKKENPLTFEMSILFEDITQIPAKFWINKQARYNEYILKKVNI